MTDDTKTAAPAPAAKPERIKKHGITRPADGTLIGKLWAIADEESAKLQAPAPRKVVIDRFLAENPIAAPATAATQYARWVMFNDASTLLKERRSVELAKAKEAKAAESAEKAAEREAKKAEKEAKRVEREKASAEKAEAAKAREAEKAKKVAEREAAAKAKADEKAAKEATKLAEKQAKEKAAADAKAKKEADAKALAENKAKEAAAAKVAEAKAAGKAGK